MQKCGCLESLITFQLPQIELPRAKFRVFSYRTTNTREWLENSRSWGPADCVFQRQLPNMSHLTCSPAMRSCPSPFQRYCRIPLSLNLACLTSSIIEFGRHEVLGLSRTGHKKFCTLTQVPWNAHSGESRHQVRNLAPLRQPGCEEAQARHLERWRSCPAPSCSSHPSTDTWHARKVTIWVRGNWNLGLFRQFSCSSSVLLPS